ncbi:MAG: SlyX family protein [Paracoccaceae bacterium]
METRLTRIEEALADALRQVEDLSDVVARQAEEIAALERRMAAMAAREAERDEGGSIVLGDRPPHW